MWKAIALTLGLAIIAMGVDKVLAQPFSLQINPNAADAYREPSNLELMNAVRELSRELSAQSTRLEMLLTLQRAALNDMTEQLDSNNKYVMDIHGRLGLLCTWVSGQTQRGQSYNCAASDWDAGAIEVWTAPFYSAENRPPRHEMFGP